MSLAPSIATKLAAFGRRWRWLIVLRGACEGVVSLLGGMTLVALIDRFFFLPEWARWALSAAMYLGTAWIVWAGCLRPLRSVPGPRELARLVECAEPKLREDLLSAVELAENKGEAGLDSLTFRKLLQTDVAKRVSGLDIEGLLPHRLISRWLGLAVGLVAAVAVLLLLPGMQFDRLFARALAPMANIDRVSRVKIAVLEPTPSISLLPRGDNVEFVIQLSGPPTEHAELETFLPDGSHQSINMNEVEGRRYTATLLLNSETVAFRFRAGDAQTKEYHLRTESRPQVTQFAKTYHYPGYTKLPVKQVQEQTGDLNALEGTDAELRITTSQPVTSGELQVETGTQRLRIPLQIKSPTELTGNLPVRLPGTYRVQLVAAATGFDNKFSPQYEIRPLADLVPHVSIDLPKGDLIVAPEEIVSLQGTATDDFGLARISQMVRVNEGVWTEFPLVETNGLHATVSRRWDLLSLKTGPGDHITTKLVAVDLKGGRGESQPLQLTVSSAGFDPKRLAALEARRSLQRVLQGLEKAASDLRRAWSYDDTKKLEQLDEAGRKQIVVAARSSLDDARRQLDRSQTLLKDALPLVAPGREASDLTLVGRVLSVLDQEPMAAAARELDAVVAKPELSVNKAEARPAVEAIQRAADLAAAVESAHNDLLTADSGDLILGDLNYLRLQQQKSVQQASTTPAQATDSWQRLSRLTAGSAQESKTVETLFSLAAGHARQPYLDRFRKLRDGLEKSRTTLEKQITNSAVASRDLLAPAQTFQRNTESAFQQMQPMQRELAQRADQARQNLERLAGSLFSRVEQLRQKAEEVANNERKLAELAKKNRTDDKLAARTEELRARLADKWKATSEELKQAAAAEERRTDADPQFANDATKAAQALDALRASTAGEQQAEHATPALKQLEQNLHALEAAHQMTELTAALRDLSDRERWEPKDNGAATDRVRDWNRIQQQMRDLPKALQSAQLPEAAAQAVQQAANSTPARAAEAEMNARQDPQHAQQPQNAPLQSLAGAVREAETQSQPKIDAARAQLTEAAPKLSDMMTGLAKAAQQMEQKSQETGQRAQQAGEAPLRDEAHALLDKQQDLSKQVQELQDALRRDANAQDIASKDGRDRSRDADDAVSMLREPPAKAEDALREASTAPDGQSQQKSLANAAAQQHKLADSLNQLSKHYQNLEAGKGDDTRMALRKAEEELGIKSALDAAYNKAEMLDELAQQTPEKMLADLEKELPKNPVMQRELKGIADNSLANARSVLQQSAKTEGDVANRLADLAHAQDAQKAAAEQAHKLADDAYRLAETDIPAARSDAEAAQVATPKGLEPARQALHNAATSMPNQHEASTQATADALRALSKPLRQAQEQLQATAKQAGQSQPSSPATQAAQAKADAAAKRSGELAQQAENLARQMADQSGNREQQMAQAANKQGPLAEDVSKAGADIARAGRHESRLGTPQGNALQQVGRDTEQVAAQQVPAAAQAIRQADQPASAQPAVGQAKSALEKQDAALQNALSQPGPPVASAADANAASPPADPASAATPEEAVWKARTLDQLDAMLNPPKNMGQNGNQASDNQSAQQAGNQQGQQGQQGKDTQGQQSQNGSQKGQQQASQNGQSNGQSQSQSAMQQALEQAKQAQQAQMMQARNNGGVPGVNAKQEGAGDGLNGEFAKNSDDPESVLPSAKALRTGEWGKLPPKVAEGLMEARRDPLSGEYRTMVETYFRVIAEKAREQK